MGKSYFNLVNERGNSVANQFVEVGVDGCMTFKSYSTYICSYNPSTKELFLNVTYLKHDLSGGSKTTMKHLYHFLRKHCGFVGLCSKKEFSCMVLNDSKVSMVCDSFFV